MGVGHRYFFIATAVLAFLAVPGVVRAESVRSSSSDIVITKDGVAQYREQISYVFEGRKHGIFRDIPVVGQIAGGKYLYYDFKLDGVTRGGADEPVSQSRKGVYQHLKIGDPNSTVGDTQDYTISYSLSPVVRKDPAGDYLTLNIHGTSWQVDALDVRGRIELPDGASIITRDCFTGTQGARSKNCIILANPDNKSVQVRATGPLAAGEGMTVDLVVQPGLFTEQAYASVSSEKPEADGSSRSFKPIALVFLGPFIAFGVVAIILVRRAMARSARRKQETIVAQYEAPKSLSPGEVGLISDEVADSREITAMLIDLARRGHITISYEQKKQLIGKKDRFLLTRNDNKGTMATAEQTLLLGIFATSQSVYVDELQPTSMYKVVQNVRSQLTTDLQSAGLFAAKQKLLSPDNLTEKGYDTWAEVEGLKLYLDVAEKDRMKFAEAPEKTPERFTKLLPYAIALGVEKQWAKQFEGIDVEPATRDWYHGTNSSNPVAFAGLMSNSFATSVASHTTPPSSSGGSGGGFSGGGVGGGGGSSW